MSRVNSMYRIINWLLKTECLSAIINGKLLLDLIVQRLIPGPGVQPNCVCLIKCHSSPNLYNGLNWNAGFEVKSRHCSCSSSEWISTLETTMDSLFCETPLVFNKELGERPDPSQMLEYSFQPRLYVSDSWLKGRGSTWTVSLPQLIRKVGRPAGVARICCVTK